jgi:hypothetical protein
LGRAPEPKPALGGVAQGWQHECLWRLSPNSLWAACPATVVESEQSSGAWEDKNSAVGDFEDEDESDHGGASPVRRPPSRLTDRREQAGAGCQSDSWSMVRSIIRRDGVRNCTRDTVCDEPWRHLGHEGRLERVPTTRFSTSKSPPIAAQPLVHEVIGQLHANNEHVSISSVTERASDDDGAAPLAVWPGPGEKLGLGGRGLESKWLSTYSWPCVNPILSVSLSMLTGGRF